ncbi:MAG: hypothetical protein FGM52_09340 [Mycobacterium sp.]|nr:hypothetical protein [Mycobacterium sp.]
MKTVIAGSALALGLLAVAPHGVANADQIQVDGSYATLAACEMDGPEVQIAQNNDAYTQWFCQQGDDGLYYVFLSN